jgi:hypothetical protein
MGTKPYEVRLRTVVAAPQGGKPEYGLDIKTVLRRKI